MKGTIIVDTREQDLHILKQLETMNIQYVRRKLDYGDYSFEVDGKSYEHEICIERKGSLDEIIGNFTKGRERFRKEFERSKGCRVVLMVEASMEQLEAGQYRSRMSPRDLKSFLKTWCNRFQLELKFVEKDRACDFILDCFRKH
jgi:ERCC4-type nuclease